MLLGLSIPLAAFAAGNENRAEQESASQEKVEKAVFPSLTFANLNKQDVQLPQGLKGDVNLVLIAFQREQQNDLDTWLKVLPEVVGKHPDVAYYEIPTIDRMNSFMRWFINTGMRGGIPDKAQRERTITLYTDKKAFREALKLASEDRVYVLAINKKGEVLWRTEGLQSAEKQASLETFLNSRH
jgi:hypothetical protein